MEGKTGHITERTFTEKECWIMAMKAAMAFMDTPEPRNEKEDKAFQKKFAKWFEKEKNKI